MRLFLVLLAILFATTTQANDKAVTDEQKAAFDTLYRVTLLRAEPGRFTELLDDMKNRNNNNHPDYLILRHSQGDHWDLMTLEPLGSYAAWFDPAKPDRQASDAKWRDHLDTLVAFRSEWFAYGPDADKVEQGINLHGLYHVEMFRSLAGHKNKLLQQRAMENEYLDQTGQVVNLVFKGDQGGDWDVMTIGFHQSLKTFAAGSDMSVAQKDVIAKKVGFKSVSDIGPYLRSLLESHNDTLAVSVN